MIPSVNLTATGRLLFDLLSTAVCDLDRIRDSRPRKGRKRASFREVDLHGHIRNTAVSPTFQNEFQAADDVPCKTTSGQRSIDYVCIDAAICVHRPPLKAINATCELKGPARPKIWQPNTKNWYEQIKNGEPYGIEPDVEKQYKRHKIAPLTEHYVFWIIENPDRGEHINLALGRLLGRLRGDLPFVSLTECVRTEIDGLWMFLFRVR
jgi:hypothetical protein